MKISEIILAYRQREGISQRQFATRCGVSNAQISMIENNKNPKTGLPIAPTIPMVRKIAEGMGMTFDELINIADDFTVDVHSKKAELRSLRWPAGTAKPSQKNEIPTGRVPLLGVIACGVPILADENIESYIDVPAFVHADFALRCRGDSMINARIFDGDVVFIRKQETVDNGEIAAVLVENEATLKKVYFYPDRVELRAENPTFKPIEYSGADKNEITILGKAVWFLSQIR